ncbi:hypothetical protein [Nocardia sp. NPDC003963]
MDDDLVIVLSEWADTASPKITEGVVVREPEDLVPVSLAVSAARRYPRNLLGYDEEATKKLTEEAVNLSIPAKNGSLWDALAAAFQTEFDTTIGKAGFAKELLGILEDSEGGTRPAGAPALDETFSALLERLSDTLRLARDRENDQRRDNRLDRIIEIFLADHATGCSRDHAAVTLAESTPRLTTPPLATSFAPRAHECAETSNSSPSR